MRTLLSTRLFAAQPFEEAPLRLARERGFLALELYGDPRHFDVLDPRAVRRVKALLGRLGMRWPSLEGPRSSRQVQNGP